MKKYIKPEVKVIVMEVEHDIMDWYGSTVEPGGAPAKPESLGSKPNPIESAFDWITDKF